MLFLLFVFCFFFVIYIYRVSKYCIFYLFFLILQREYAPQHTAQWLINRNSDHKISPGPSAIFFLYAVDSFKKVICSSIKKRRFRVYKNTLLSISIFFSFFFLFLNIFFYFSDSNYLNFMDFFFFSLFFLVYDWHGFLFLYFSFIYIFFFPINK